MTAKRRLVPLSEIQAAHDWWLSLGYRVGGIDIRADGVTFLPPASESRSAYDAFKAQEQSRDRSQRRSQ